MGTLIKDPLSLLDWETWSHLALPRAATQPLTGDIDQSVGGGLLLALGIAEDGSAETNGDADEVLSGHDALYRGLVSCIFVVH